MYFSIEEIKKAVYYSKMAYEYDENIIKDDLLYTFEENEFKLLIFRNKNKIIFSFQGSETKKNWLTNFRYYKKYDKDLDVNLHRGYKETADKLFKRLSKIFLQNIYKEFDFEFYGHSAGGAIAEIIALKFARYIENVSKIITFGTPKITDRIGAKKLTESNLINTNKILRIINDKDIVNLLPINSLFNYFFKNKKYQHFGNEIILLDNKKISFNDFNKVLNKNYELFKNIDKDSIKEHYINSYISKINRLDCFDMINHTFGV